MKSKLGMEFTLGRACLYGALALALTGCCGDKFWTVQTASSIQDAGAVHIAVLTVSTFEKYRDSVQPQFKLSTDDALNQVLPSTLAFEERIVNLLGLSLKLKAALPSTTGAGATTATGQSGSQSSTDQGSATTSKSSDSSGSTAGTPTAASLPGGGSVTSATLGQDPLLKFWTAAALYQEVQLLNRYVQDAAIPEDFTAFVVRLQVTLLPWARREPYDAYADISFFMGDFSLEDRSEQTLKWDGRTSQNEVRILPLLVTDDIEAALEARSFDRIRQLALALSASMKGVGLESNLESVNEQLQSVTGRDYNSAFTLARVSHNTLRVRFGALNQGMARYSMIPQTHNVTLLLMVPTKPGKKGLDNRTVRLVSRTAFIDARNGNELMDDPKRRIEEIGGALKDCKIDPEKEKKGDECLHECLDLPRLVAGNNWAEFRECVNRKCVKKKNYPEPLWVELASLREESRYQTATLTLPKYDPVLGLEGQTPLLIDDGKSSISTKLVGIRDLNQKKLMVDLKASTCSLCKDGKLLKESVKRDTDGKVLEGTCRLDKGGKVLEGTFKLHKDETAQEGTFKLDKDETAQEGTFKLDEGGKVLGGTFKLDKDETVQVVPCKEVYVAAASIKPDLGDGEFLVTFPSLRAVKWQPINDEATVVVSTGDERSPVYGAKNKKKYRGVYAVMQKPPLFALSVLAGVINSDEKGQGTLVINVKKAPDSDTFPAAVTLKISGADFDVSKVTTDPAGIRPPPDPTKDQDPRSLKVTKPGAVTLVLFNLNPESNVTVSGTDESDTSSTPITVRVVSLPKSKQKMQE